MMKRRAFLGWASLAGAPAVLFADTYRPAMPRSPLASPSGSIYPAPEPARGQQDQVAVDVRSFGAKGDGVTDDAPAIQRAVDSARAVYFPQGTYVVGSAITMTTGSSLRGDGSATLMTHGNSYIIRAVGAIGERLPMRESIRAGDNGFRAGQHAVSSFTPGGGFLLQSDDVPLGHPSHRAAELGLVERVTREHIEATVAILGNYRVQSDVRAAPVDVINGLSISGLRFRNSNYRSNPQRVTSALIYFELVNDFSIFNCDLHENNGAAINIFNCLNGTIQANSVGHLADGGRGLLGYGVQVGFCSQNISIVGNSFTRCRHAVTTGTGTVSSLTPNYGISRGIAMIANAVSQCTNSGLDTHEDSDGVTISANTVVGCLPAGIHVRSHRTTITANSVTSCRGQGIRVSRTAQDTIVSSNIIHNIVAHGEHADGILIDSRAVVVCNNLISACDRHGIALARQAQRAVTLSGNMIKNNGQGRPGDAINIDGGGALSEIVILGNTCLDDQPMPTQRHSLRLEPGTVLSACGCTIASNVFSQSRAASVSDAQGESRLTSPDSCQTK